MLAQLKRRREALVERSCAQRGALVEAVAPFTGKLALVDRSVAAMRSHPLVTGVALGAVALVGPRRLLKWALRALTAFSLVRRMRGRQSDLT